MWVPARRRHRSALSPSCCEITLCHVASRSCVSVQSLLRAGEPSSVPRAFLHSTHRRGGHQRGHHVQGDPLPGGSRRHALHAVPAAPGGAAWHQGKSRRRGGGWMACQGGRTAGVQLQPRVHVCDGRARRPQLWQCAPHTCKARSQPCFPQLSQPQLCASQSACWLQVDEGLVPLEGCPEETSTRGLDTLAAACKVGVWRGAGRSGSRC